MIIVTIKDQSLQYFCYFVFERAEDIGQLLVDQFVRRTSTYGQWIVKLYWFQKIANTWGAAYTGRSYKHIIYAVISR